MRIRQFIKLIQYSEKMALHRGRSHEIDARTQINGYFKIYFHHIFFIKFIEWKLMSCYCNHDTKVT